MNQSFVSPMRAVQDCSIQFHEDFLVVACYNAMRGVFQFLLL